MIKILDSNGNTYTELADDIFNNLNKSPFTDSIGANSVFLYNVIVYNPDNKQYSLAYIMSRLPDAVKALNSRIDNVKLTPGPPGEDSKVPGPKGDPGVPTRVERYSSFSTDANGVVSITFSKPFTSIPDCDIVESWTSTTPSQQVVGSVTEVTLTGCKAQVMLSQGTLVLNAAPFAKAGAGIKPIIRAIGK